MPDREQTCTMKNRMRESRSFGSVRGEGSNVLAYSESTAGFAACRRPVN